jgi:hypothetical protein
MTFIFTTISAAADYGKLGRWLLLVATVICWGSQFAAMSLTGAYYMRHLTYLNLGFMLTNVPPDRAFTLAGGIHSLRHQLHFVWYHFGVLHRDVPPSRTVHPYHTGDAR